VRKFGEKFFSFSLRKKKDMSLLLAGRVSPPPSSPPARVLARKAKKSRRFSSLRASSSAAAAAARLNAAGKERATTTTSSKLRRREGFRGKIRSRNAFALTKNAKNATACRATAGGNSDDDGSAANMSARELKRALGEMVRFPSFLCLSCLVLLQKVHSLSKEKNVDD
jgi:hypothetical protein